MDLSLATAVSLESSQLFLVIVVSVAIFLIRQGDEKQDIMYFMIAGLMVLPLSIYFIGQALVVNWLSSLFGVGLLALSGYCFYLMYHYSQKMRND
jgi:Ca2+/Na+ antiporter